MKKTYSMKYNRDFKRLYSKGNCVHGAYLVMYYKRANITCNILGITVTKKLGKAHIRNRCRRLIKESYRLKEENIGSGYYIVFVARSRMVGLSYEQISRDMNFLLKKSGIIKERTDAQNGSPALGQ